MDRQSRRRVSQKVLALGAAVSVASASAVALATPAAAAAPCGNGAGGTVTYTPTVTNAGPTTAYGVRAAMTLPAGVRAAATVISSSPTASTGTAFPGQPFQMAGLIWNVGDMASGAGSTYTVVVTVTGSKGARLTNLVAAGPPNLLTDPNLVNNDNLLTQLTSMVTIT